MTIGSSAARRSVDTTDSGSALPSRRDTDELRSPDRGANDALTILIAVPTLDHGAADAGAVDLARILAAAGHHPIVVSRGGRLEGDVAAAGGETIRLDMASRNPLTTLRNTAALMRLIRERRCRVVHAHGRAAAWSAYLAARLTRVPFLTTWYKGFREQNLFKHLYNSVMARGDRVFAVSDQIADIIVDRYDTPSDRIVITHSSIDYDRFDPAAVADDRIETMRHAWGVTGETRIVLVTGRMVRRKGHHVVVLAAQRLKECGFKDFVCVFTGEDEGRSRYTGELWDLVLATGTADVIRMSGHADDLPAAYAAASVVVSGAIQAEGLQRGLLEALAMARPVVVSDLAAGPEVVQAPPLVPEERMSGLRVPAGDDAALAAALIRLLSLPEASRRAIGSRGRDWVVNHFDADTMIRQTLAVYSEVARSGRR